MSIVLNGTTHRLQSASFGASRPSAYTMALFVRPLVAPTGSVTRVIMALSDSAAYNRGDLYLSWDHTTAAARRTAELNTTGSTYVHTNTAASSTHDVWYHYGASYSAGALKMFVDGSQVGATATPTTSATAPTNWVVNVGSALNGDTRLNCRVAQIGYWDVALTDAEMAALGKGVSPHLVRPQSLKWYVRGLRTANAQFGSTGTATNLTYSDDNPRIYL